MSQCTTKKDRLSRWEEAVNVESEGIEPSSREDHSVRSTCLVDFGFRDVEGRQQPNNILSYFILAARNSFTRSSSCCRHRYTSARRTKALSDDGLPDLIGDELT